MAQDRGFTVHREKVFTVSGRKLKPDLVLYTNDRVHSLDVQIINDQFPLQEAHLTKKRKYKDLEQQLGGLRSGGFRCDTLTVNWKGVVAGSSYKEFMAFGMLRKNDFKIISSRTLIGGCILHGIFQHMTSVRQKKGVG